MSGSVKKNLELPKNPRSILFVCTGNSCRSVIAEGLFQKMLVEAGRDIKVTSAGVSSFTGMPPTEETIRVCGERGVDMSRHRGRRISAAIAKESDIIFVMQPFHKEHLLAMAPNADKKTYVISDFLPHSKSRQSNMGIPDPIGRGFHYYVTVTEMIQEALDRIFSLLKD